MYDLSVKHYYYCKRCGFLKWESVDEEDLDCLYQ